MHSLISEPCLVAATARPANKKGACCDMEAKQGLTPSLLVMYYFLKGKQGSNICDDLNVTVINVDGRNVTIAGWSVLLTKLQQEQHC